MIAWIKTNGKGVLKTATVNSGTGAITFSSEFEWADTPSDGGSDFDIVNYDVIIDYGQAAETTERIIVVYQGDDREPKGVVVTESGGSFTKSTEEDMFDNVHGGGDGTSDVGVISLEDIPGNDGFIFCYGLANYGAASFGGMCTPVVVDHDGADGSLLTDLDSANADCFVYVSGATKCHSTDDTDQRIKWIDIEFLGATSNGDSTDQYVVIYNNDDQDKIEVIAAELAYHPIHGAKSSVFPSTGTQTLNDDSQGFQTVDLAYDNTNDKFVAAWTEGDIRYRVGSVDANEAITLGTEASVAATSGNRYVNVEYADTTVSGAQGQKGFAFTWEDTDDDGQVRFGILDGTSITWSSKEEFSGTSVQRMGLTYDSNAGWFVIVYKDHSGGASDGGNARAFSIPEFGSLVMPVLSVLAIVGLNYRKRNSL